MVHYHPPYSTRTRIIFKAIFIVLLLSLVGAAATIPFIWESKSLWYKSGVDKILLQVGKVFGLAAAILIFLQIVLAVKLKFMDRVLGVDRLYLLHQFNGFAIITLALLHAALILIPEGIDNLPIGWKFWPEIVGAAALLLLLAIVFSAQLRGKLITYTTWRMVHRPLGYLMVGGIAVHILYVSDSFENSVPKYGLFALLGFLALVILISKIGQIRQASNLLQIKELRDINSSTLSLKLKTTQRVAHLPGQFAIISFSGAGVSKEPHPFTIASAPNEDLELQFYIKKSGDWTSSISRYPESSVKLLGPYGLFSYVVRDTPDTLIFIAAGIGITPMLSMLKQIEKEDNQPEVLLIWSMRNHHEMFLQEELEKLSKTITQFTVHHIYTRESGGERLNRDYLKQVIPGNIDSCHIYLCGPEKMMKETTKYLLSLNIDKNQIFQERFAL